VFVPLCYECGAQNNTNTTANVLINKNMISTCFDHHYVIIRRFFIFNKLQRVG